MSWNARDQLTHLSTPQLSASFAYDPLGRRTSFTKGSVSKSYFYNGLDMLSDGSARYLHGAGLDEPLEMQPSGTAPAQSYLQDHLGSTTRLLHAATGQDTARYDYTSYGDLEGNASNPSLMNPYTYTGREDDGTGLMYYRARYYDPELEVFISQDPLGDKQRYVGGNPMGFVDPFGLRSLTIFYGDDQGAVNLTNSLFDNPTNDYRVAKNKEELRKVLDDYVKNTLNKGESFDNLKIYSHGNTGSLGYGSEDNLGIWKNPNTGTSDLEDAFSPLKNRQPKRITLNACNTGNNLPGGNFAEHLAKFLPGTLVSAPNNFTQIWPLGIIVQDNGKFNTYRYDK